MQFSESVSRISVSSTLAVVMKSAQLRASGISVVDFGAGEPDFATPEPIRRAAIAALESGFTHYTPTGGIRDLKQAVVDRHAQDFGSDYRPEECLVTVGGKQAIFEALVATLNPGDEVILPVPYWVSFLDIIHYAGGHEVTVETREEENFTLRAAQVEARLTPRTRVIIVNSPNNPTGAVVPPGEMEKLLELAAQHNLLLISDECYCQFLYDGRKPYSLGSTHQRENLLIVGSLSKTYAMTGWRVGFALGAPPLLSAMLKLQSHSTSNPTSFAQMGALEALRGPQRSVAAMRDKFAHRRQLVVSGLRAIPGIQCTEPEGAFYVYPNVGEYLRKKGLPDSQDLAVRLLDEAHVALVPGPAFGTAEHVRISYATSEEQINEGLRRLREFFSRS